MSPKLRNRQMILLTILNICQYIFHGAGCELKYKYPVDEKPDIFVITDNFGICRIRHEATSTLDYGENNFENADPETRIHNLHYDARNGTIFYIARGRDSVSRIYEARLEDGRRKLILDQEDLSYPSWPFATSVVTSSAYDWVTKNMYLNFYEFIGVINVEEPWEIGLTVARRKQISQVTVHPNRGYLFFVDVISNGDSRLLVRSIHRSHLDGSNTIELSGSRTNVLDDITNLAVDHYEDKLYWSITGEDAVYHSQLDGRDVRSVNGVRVHYDVPGSESRYLAIDRSYVYYRSADANSVRRFSKGTYLEDEEYELTSRGGAIKEVMILTHATQRIRKGPSVQTRQRGV